MNRRAMGGKRIRLDDPIPPEFDNPQTPMTPAMNDHEDPSDSYHRAYAATPATPQYSGSEHYNESEYERESSYDHTDPDAMDTSGMSMEYQAYANPATPLPQRVTRARAKGGAPPPPVVPPLRLQSLKRTAPVEDEMAMEARRPGRKKRAVYGGSAPTTRADESSLYFTIMSAKCSLQSVVDDWIENYKVNKDEALLALMQFFINAAGCKGKITAEMHKWEHAAIIRKMTEEFDESSGEYPLISAGQQWKKFKTQFTEFVQVLVKQCQYSIIYDQYLMDNVISLLTGLSDSQVRAFRHTATLAAMKLMTALVDVALTVSVNTDNTLRQYEAERQKAQNKRATDRLESLLLKRTELDENMDEIKNMLTYMFKSVFVHRYRDTLPEIRAICMTEIGIWMRKFHTNFLDDSYLKYIGWTLHDRVGEVRLKCLQALIPLYESEELKSKLELFTSKFKDRIVSMTLDREYEVAVQAVRLVISILKHHRDILTDKDCEHVYELVYSSHRAVSQAAGEFLNERLFTPDDDCSNLRTHRGKKRSPNTPLIRDLVQFFIESELHEHGAYLVDSLIDSNQMVKDWECMTDLLLEDPGPNEEPLDNRQETSLIEIMVCAIKQSATGEQPVGRGSSRKILSQKETKAIQDDKQKLTSHFIVTLPALLDKFSSDPEKLANLLCIPQYFDLELYTKSRQEMHLDSLLAKMSKIVDKREDQDVLETASKTLEILCYEGHANYTKCQTARDTMIENIVTKYREAIDEWNSLIAANDEIPNEDEIFNVESSLKKIHIFYSSHDLGKWGLWESLYKDVVDCARNDTRLPERAMKNCIGATFFALQWELSHIEDLLAADGAPDREVAILRGRLNEYMETMKELIMSSISPVYQEEAYNVLCDYLVIFCERLALTRPLESLVYTADAEMRELLNRFVQNFVFNTSDDTSQDDHHSRIEELHKKRNFLASYCKLIVYNMIPVKAGADIFKHYVRHYNRFGDIIKHTVGKTREINKTSCAITMVTSLITLFQQLQRDVGGHKINKHSDEFMNIKELAKRFALSFGLDAVKNRDAITVLHRDGIKFAVNPLENPDDPSGPPPNILFLEIILEFTNKLLKQDKKLVLQLLDRKIGAGMPSSRGEDWLPLISYRNTLIQGEADMPPATSRRAYRPRRKDAEEDHIEEDD